MHVVVSTMSAERSRDLGQLRDWLDSAGEMPWQLRPTPTEGGDSLGFGVDEICAIVTASAELPALVDRIREWFSTRHAPEAVQLTITVDPAEPEPPAEPESSPDEQPT